MARGERDYKGDLSCDCGRNVPAYLTGGGMLTTSCGWCRLQKHAPMGSASFRDMQAKLKAGDNPDQPIAPSEKAPQKPAQVKKIEPVFVEVKKVDPVPEKTIFDIFK